MNIHKLIQIMMVNSIELITGYKEVENTNITKSIIIEKMIIKEAIQIKEIMNYFLT